VEGVFGAAADGTVPVTGVLTVSVFAGWIAGGAAGFFAGSSGGLAMSGGGVIGGRANGGGFAASPVFAGCADAGTAGAGFGDATAGNGAAAGTCMTGAAADGDVPVTGVLTVSVFVGWIAGGTAGSSACAGADFFASSVFAGCVVSGFLPDVVIVSSSPARRADRAFWGVQKINNPSISRDSRQIRRISFFLFKDNTSCSSIEIRFLDSRLRGND
jgi:hypothetical protein